MPNLPHSLWSSSGNRYAPVPRFAPCAPLANFCHLPHLPHLPLSDLPHLPHLPHPYLPHRPQTAPPCPPSLDSWVQWRSLGHKSAITGVRGAVLPHLLHLPHLPHLLGKDVFAANIYIKLMTRKRIGSGGAASEESGASGQLGQAGQLKQLFWASKWRSGASGGDINLRLRKSRWGKWGNINSWLLQAGARNALLRLASARRHYAS